MKDIKEVIDVLKAASTNIKVNHMMKEMSEGVNSEEVAEYRENLKAIETTIKILEKQFL